MLRTHSPISRTWSSLASIAALMLVLLLARPGFAQLSTSDHVADPGFWPTQDQGTRKNYVGPATCARCHASIAATQATTPMARTFGVAAAAPNLHAHPHLSFQSGIYLYQINTSAAGPIYSVTDGTKTLSAPLRWAFGTPEVGQSYLFLKDDGKIYEARATYFTSLKNLDFTPARALAHPKDLEEAMGRPLGSGELTQCFSCHTTAATIGGKFDPARLIPGVSCEACHGPGVAHVAAMQAYRQGKAPLRMGTILNPARLSPTDSIDFCGACHSTWWDLKLSGVHGPSTTRSPPYRLETSKCWRSKPDVRLTCMACHDPHVPLQTSAASYDRNCLSCHVTSADAPRTASHPGAACPVAKQNCTSCHMPKVYVPEMHGYFTDHRIRIAQANAPFPE